MRKLFRFVCCILLLWSGLSSCEQNSIQDKVDSKPPQSDLMSSSAGKPSDSSARIVFLGDSLTAGFGLPPEQSYPSLIAGYIEEAGLPFQVVNAGVSGDTSAGGLRRVSWLLRSKIDVLVLALGANDGLRGLPVEETEENLLQIISKVREENPDATIIVTGMLVPPNMGPSYADGFSKVFPEVAQKANAVLLPFLLEGVAAEPELNLADGIHPNREGQEIIAKHLWKLLEPLLRKLQSQASLSQQNQTPPGTRPLGSD